MENNDLLAQFTGSDFTYIERIKQMSEADILQLAESEARVDAFSLDVAGLPFNLERLIAGNLEVLNTLRNREN